MRYWIGVASRDHVEKGVKGGFCQLCHGKATPLKRMMPGDWIIYYSPKETFNGNEPCQRFTALGQISESEVYPFEMFPGFIPFRRNVAFITPCKPTPIRPLIPRLLFIDDPKKWGYKFRFGHFEIPKEDFELIAGLMRATPVSESNLDLRE
ncbi:EVE domain-containing protein [Hydrogenovibrio sp. JE_KL2]|uniref:EVE domain-containing protein n=1 Tax=Hydrogenovibrio sp. JE_KL2 TaxID=2651188 RepID=UPI00128DB079|nr:EVE domain-containing protein [Hydrogenovibrio sp. JE_KL2]MPQ76104.1 EVE domain-containing protein [Hydrogenovibrio sp. JE_KL2]